MSDPTLPRMSDPTMCRGKDSDGNQCICIRCSETETVKGKLLCKSCGHIESAHPEPKASVGSIIRGFRDAGKLGSSSGGSSVKASNEEAVAETSAGLRKKRKSDTDTEPPAGSKKPKAGKDIAKKKNWGEESKSNTGRWSSYHTESRILPDAVQDGALRQSKVPKAEVLEQMRSAGLVVLNSPKTPLVINTGWDCDDMKKEIAKLLPKPMEWLERQEYPGDPNDPTEIQEQLWRGVKREGKNLTVGMDALPTGVVLGHHCNVRGSTSKVKIPEKNYLNWDASESEPESEDLGSDIETVLSEDIIMSPPKPVLKKKKRKSKIKVEPGYDGESQQESDMRKAAKMRTRISTGTITYKPLFIPGSSDGPDPEPQDAPSKSGEVLIVSNDEDFPPPAPTLAPSPPSVIASAWKSPLQIHQSLSPDAEDSPSFFADFDYGLNEADYSSIINTTASSSSGASSSSSVPIASSSTPPSWAVPSSSSHASFGDSSADTSGEPSSVAPSRPRFKCMGKGRAGRDPWSTTTQ
ncbi:hypothetical protein FB451DRAFT_1180882 [Mycena latifolia]|nr:hypothetical protein FB451DRAFT_1180882 [Mycena latifolia]